MVQVHPSLWVAAQTRAERDETTRMLEATHRLRRTFELIEREVAQGEAVLARMRRRAARA